MKFVCQDIERPGFPREITTLKTLVHWSGKTEEEIKELSDDNEDGFIIDGFMFNPLESKVKKQKKVKKPLTMEKPTRQRLDIIGLEEWELKEGYMRTYKLDGKEIRLRDLAKEIKTGLTTILRYTEYYKRVKIAGRLIETTQTKKEKTYNIYYKNKLIHEDLTEQEAMNVMGKKRQWIRTYASTNGTTNTGYRIERIVDTI